MMLVLSNNLKKQKRDYSHTTPLLSMLFLIAITRDLRKVIHLKGRLTFLFFLSITNGNTICNTTHIAVG
ncbi:hypothetical protein DBS1_130055 [Escherichia coli]|nr:hypothetical protein DBS1_130055 [Escherichia coli]